MAALERANEIRLVRAEVKRAIREGRVSIVAALDERCLASMTVEALLCSQRRWGSARALKTLRALEINPARCVGDLTARQRRMVAQACGRTGRRAAA
jgi:hypothetical protein